MKQIRSPDCIYKEIVSLKYRMYCILFCEECIGKEKADLLFGQDKEYITNRLKELYEEKDKIEKV